MNNKTYDDMLLDNMLSYDIDAYNLYRWYTTCKITRCTHKRRKLIERWHEACCRQDKDAIMNPPREIWGYMHCQP